MAWYKVPDFQFAGEPFIKNVKLICPIHRYSYDIHTGKGDPGQHDFVDVYPVEIRDDGVYIGISSFLEKVKQAFK